MGKHAQIEQGQKAFVAPSRRGVPRPLPGQEWQKDLLTSWLFQTCIKLQTALDRRFLRLGMTMQEANVLLRCVEVRRITPGQLAMALGRDKSKITRFIDRLESSRLVTRDIGRRDRRISILKPTAKGKQVAQDLAYVLDSIRKELFAGISESDVLRVGKLLPQLYKNAVRIGSRQKCEAVRERRRIGIREMKPEGPPTSPPQITVDTLMRSPEGRAANSARVEQQSLEGGLIRREENATPGMLVNDQEAWVLK